jgi:uncharacterized repeat protein (TIGR02543 family)
MKNNRHMKMIAWVMAAIMLLCAMPLSAMADAGIKPGDNFVDDDFAITDANAFVKVEFFKEDGKTKIDLATADRSSTYKMVLTVDEDEDAAPFPTEGYMIYKLPSEVESAESNTDGNGVVAWTYYSSTRELEFSWVNGNNNTFTAVISVRLANVFPLYNLAALKINGTDVWYRLAKSTIRTSKPYKAYSNGTGLKETDYDADPYNFSGLTFTANDVTYIAECDVDPENPAPFFTVKVEKLEAQHNKIGGMNGNNPRWVTGLADSEKFNEDPKTGGYHRNYRITLHEANEAPYLQTLYNFLGREDRQGSYFRLKKTQIIARDPQKLGNNTEVKEGQYTLVPEGDYDFTNVILTLDGVEYKYSPVAPTGLYDENIFTTKLDRIYVRNVMHHNASWYSKEEGWLDDSKSTFTPEELANNNITALHRDYAYTTYDANAYRIDIFDGEEKINTVLVAKNDVAELPNPVKEGYQFIGWQTEDGAEFDASTPVTGSIKLLVQWEQIANTAETTTPNDQGITYHSSLAQYKQVFVGTEITISADIEGYEQPYGLQWVYEDPKEPGVFHTVDGATERTYTFILDMVNSTYTYYILVIPQ